MQESLSKKLQGFRRQIRREQIEAFKKSKRKELIEDSNCSGQLQQTYWGVLKHHQLASLRQMSYQVFQCHLQMIHQVVFSQQSCIFVDAFEKIIVILVDFYEEALNSWMEEARRHLDNVNVDQMEAVESIDVYALTKVFSFIPVNNFLKIIGGIYHDINPQRNITYLRKVVAILKDILYFSFIDYEHIKQLLQYFEAGLDLRLNKTISKDFVLTALMNISYSEEEDVIKLLKQENIFGRIMESVQLYGIQLKQFQTLSGLYSNCIEYLCSTVHSFPVVHESQTDFEQEQVSSLHLYLPIFEALVALDSQVVIQHLVRIACCLLKTASECDLSCKSYIMTMIQTLVRNIITANAYVPDSEQLFILCANQFEFTNTVYPFWLADLLSIIFKDYVMAYYGDETGSNKTKFKYQSLKKGKILRDIKEVLNACQILLSRCDTSLIQFQELLVRSIFQFWFKEDLIMGSHELITFLQIAIDHNQELSNYIIFDNYQEQFIDFIDGSYETLEEINAILRLVNSTCNRLESVQISKFRAYVSKYTSKWTNILMRIEGYCQGRQVSEGQYSHLANHLYERVQKLLKEADNL